MPELVLEAFGNIRGMLRAPIRSDLYALTFIEQIASVYVTQAETNLRDAIYAGEVQAAGKRLYDSYTALLREMRRDPGRVSAIEEVLVSAFYIGLVCDRDALPLQEALNVAQKARAHKGASSNKQKAKARHKHTDEIVLAAALASKKRGFTNQISSSLECVGRLMRDPLFVTALVDAGEMDRAEPTAKYNAIKQSLRRLKNAGKV